MAVLLQAGAALAAEAAARRALCLARRGAALLTVPGLEAMVRHHAVLYRDLADPVAPSSAARRRPSWRGSGPMSLAPARPRIRSAHVGRALFRLMADSQALVAEDTLRLVDLSGARHLMDVGGGTGRSWRAAVTAHPACAHAVRPARRGGRRPRRRGAGARASRDRARQFPRRSPAAGADTISLCGCFMTMPTPRFRALLAAVRGPAARRAAHRVRADVGRRPARSGDTDVYFALLHAGDAHRSHPVCRARSALLLCGGLCAHRALPGPRPYITCRDGSGPVGKLPLIDRPGVNLN
jgi:demethylspheroidene O-methyltransferase